MIGRVVQRLGARWVNAVVLMLLVACTSLPKPSAVVDVDTFQRSGRFSITTTPVEGAPQAVQGGFSWRDNGREYLLDLINPLGAIEARVQGRPGSAHLTRANGSQLEASDPDLLAEAVLGSPVPVSSLREWLRGRVATESAVRMLQRDEQGRPVVFEQGGWTARLSRYDAVGPQMLLLERQAFDRRITVRLVVHEQ